MPATTGKSLCVGRSRRDSLSIPTLKRAQLTWGRDNDLQPDKVLQDRFDQGHAVGELATTLFPGGVLIDLPHDAVEQRIEETREAIAGEAPAVFEASFLEHNTFVAVDMLEPSLPTYVRHGARKELE